MKTQINKRFQARYDFLMERGQRGHYETMFKCLHEELQQALEAQHRETWAMAMEAAASHIERGISHDNALIYNLCTSEALCIRNLPCPPLETKESEE